MATNDIAPDLQHLAVPVQDLSLWPGNPRQGDIGALVESLKRFGQVRPILVQKSSMQIVAGNHLYRAATALGWTEVAAVVADLSTKEAKAYVLADNRTSELGDFNETALAELMAQVAREGSLDGTGYDRDDLDALLAKIGSEGKGFGNGDPDAVKPPPEKPWVEEGMIFHLGDHRLICGDGTDAMVLADLLGGETPDLLIVQPPAKGNQNPLDIRDAASNINEQLWFSPEKYGLLLLEDGGSFFVWDKQSENTRREYGDAFELIYSVQPHPPASVYRFTLVGALDGEVATGPDFNERPSTLWMEVFERFSGFNSIILDPIALGATPLLAAEKLGRRYYGAKTSPALVQATLEKWAEYAHDDLDEIRRRATGG